MDCMRKAQEMQLTFAKNRENPGPPYLFPPSTGNLVIDYFFRPRQAGSSILERSINPAAKRDGLTIVVDYFIFLRGSRCPSW